MSLDLVQNAPAAIGSVPKALTGRIVTPEQRRFFQQIPKVELHCHLLGAVRRETFAALAHKHSAPLSAEDIEGFYTRGDKPVGVLRVLRALESSLLLEPDDFRRIAYEYLEDAASENVRHAEFFWNPTASLRDAGLAYGDMQAAIVAGIRAAEADFGITALLIPSIDREAEPSEALRMVDLMLSHRDEAVAGIGIDYRETERPPELFLSAYDKARAAGLKATAHAGEFGMPWTNVATAVERLGVNRVDHGYTVIENPAFAEACAAKGMVFTIVPTNSYYLRTLSTDRWAADHPIRRMAELGLKLHPNTDDPTLHHITPAGAWELMYSHLGFDIADLRQMMLNGIDGAWAKADQKDLWRSQWPAQFDALAADVAWDRQNRLEPGHWETPS
jgi:adenine deaminase